MTSSITDSKLSLFALVRGRQARIPVTLGLIGANLVVFVVMLFFGAGPWHSSGEVQLSWGANFGPATQDGQWWRLGSAMFLHFGLLHLCMNMLALWDAGRIVERMYGSARFLQLYLLAGVGGNLLSLSLRGGQAVSGGASGAIFGLYGALIVCVWRARHHLQASEFRWLFWGAAGFSLSMIVVGQLFPIIDNAAHAGGLVSGAMVGFALSRPLAGEPRVSCTGRIGAASLLLAAVTVAVLVIPEPRYLWSEELNARKEIQQFLRQEAAIAKTWRSLLSQGEGSDGLTFNQLAGEIEDNVVIRYEDSFDHISEVHIDPDAPSAATLVALRNYAAVRRDAARVLAEGLRSNDEEKIKAAMEMAKKSGKSIGPVGDKSVTRQETSVPDPKVTTK